MPCWKISDEFRLDSGWLHIFIYMSEQGVFFTFNEKNRLLGAN